MCGVDALERVNDFVTTVLNLFVPKMRDGGGVVDCKYLRMII